LLPQLSHEREHDGTYDKPDEPQHLKPAEAAYQDPHEGQAGAIACDH